MPRIEIKVYPYEKKRDFSLSNSLASIILLAKENGTICKINSAGAIIEGNKDTILQIIKELDGNEFYSVAKKFSISIDFSDSEHEDVALAK